MPNNWNKAGFFSGITEDYSNYRWCKGESTNPYLNDEERPLTAHFWEYEKEFHFSFLDRKDFETPIAEAYQQWKEGFIHDYLPGKAAHAYGDDTDWAESFELGLRVY